MIKVFSIFMIAGLVFCTQSCKPSDEEAVEYNNTIVEIESKAELIVNGYFKNFNADDPNNNQVVKQSVAQISECKKKLQAVQEIKGGEAFKAAGIEMLSSYEAFFKVEVPIWIAALTDPKRTDESLLAAQSRFAKAKNKALESQYKFEKAQADFAKLYGFELK